MRKKRNTKIQVVFNQDLEIRSEFCEILLFDEAYDSESDVFVEGLNRYACVPFTLVTVQSPKRIFKIAIDFSLNRLNFIDRVEYRLLGIIRHRLVRLFAN